MDIIGQIKRGPELDAFLDLMAHIGALHPVWELLVTVDNDGVKVKVNGGPWSRPFGRVKPDPSAPVPPHPEWCKCGHPGCPGS